MSKRKQQSRTRPAMVRIEGFDAEKEVAEIKELRKIQRPIQYRQRVSKLTPLTGELLSLRQAGATLGDLKMWLQKRVNIEITTASISRFLSKVQG